jgi:hypothetical protein
MTTGVDVDVRPDERREANTYVSTDKFGATGSNIRATKPRRE